VGADALRVKLALAPQAIAAGEHVTIVAVRHCIDWSGDTAIQEAVRTGTPYSAGDHHQVDFLR
jgi:hypothetical protein